MHVQVLLFSSLAEAKNTRKKLFRDFWGEVSSENVGESRKDEEPQRWSGEKKGDDHTHNKGDPMWKRVRAPSPL